MNKPELSHDRNQWIAYALFLEESNSTLKEESAKQTDNNASPKLHRSVCRHCTGDQFRCESCDFGSEFNPNCATSGE